jgi:fluoride ion exporter CrcB/FEX
VDIWPVINESLGVFRKNLLMAVPAATASVVIHLMYSVAGGMPHGSYAIALMGLISMTLTLYAHGVTLAMAREALDEGAASLMTAAFTARAGLVPFLVASAAISLVVGMGSVLFLLPGLAAAYFLMFALPSIVMEGRGPFGALLRSIALVWANRKESMAVFVAVVIGALVLGMVDMFISLIPVAGQLASIALTGGFMGVLALFVLKSFRLISERTD